MDFADEACSLSEVRRRRTLSHRAAAEASVASHNVDDARTSNANDDHKQHKAAATKMPKTSKRECALASLRSRLRSFCAPPLCAPCFGYGRSLWAVPFTSGEVYLYLKQSVILLPIMCCYTQRVCALRCTGPHTLPPDAVNYGLPVRLGY